MQDLYLLSKKYAELDKIEKNAKDEKETIKLKIAEIVRDNFKNLFITVSFTEPTTVESADSEKMKNDGIWDDYKKTSERKGSIKVSVKEKGLKEYELINHISEDNNNDIFASSNVAEKGIPDDIPGCKCNIDDDDELGF